jgi:hypothetical protein
LERELKEVEDKVKKVGEKEEISRREREEVERVVRDKDIKLEEMKKVLRET